MAGSKIAVYGAIAADVAIAVTKFIVAGITGSSAMLSEGVHSVVDTGNGVLLLFGLHRSKRPASAEHPFGHGRELFFWSLIVAVMIFGLGGGVSIVEGLNHMRHLNDADSPDQVAATIRTIKDEIRARYPKISRIYIEAQAADRIDAGAGG